ncbi:Biogenesis of lysosome-related organelles complex 1 subunit 6 [Blattella germanica]|nr:Biogenesis of lysosome-related organelles complex 1 subunit 6 [Blattella germanica]
MTDNIIITESLSSKLAEGLLSLYEPDLKRVKQQLDELTKKQGTLVSQLQEENARFNNIQTSDDLQQMFITVKLYQSKLIAIKKEMAHLHDRATKLKKRALKLQQAKQKQALQRESQIQREADLIAKPQTSQPM